MMSQAPTLAIDLGGTKLLLALIHAGKVVDRIEAATDRTAGPDAWVAQMAGHAKAWQGRFVRAGVTVTGLVKDGSWRALNHGTLNIPGQFPLLAKVGAALGVPVTLCNDAQAAAWAEHIHGAGKGRDIVFLTVSTGIGGGVVSAGRLLQGRSGLAGHFGQLLPFPEGGDQRFEDGASGRWIASQAAGHGMSDAHTVFAAAGQPWADQIIQTSARRVARLCHDLQLMFDPELTIIGGGVGLAPGYIERLMACVAPLEPLVRPTFVPAALGKDAGVIGVADLSTRNQPNREETT